MDWLVTGKYFKANQQGQGRQLTDLGQGFDIWLSVQWVLRGYSVRDGV